ncbi:MAG TPA: cob(I)yrinic acid a,c-diamide adenosyltransferase [Thermoplasmatales archaeon]|nr:cob(I)yrinic acid a,c-diamide adenosyltransferase [Thermoplasmatales archaeon]
MKGKIFVLTGDGKGKTTSAFGMALRAVGHRKKVAIVQFMKSGEYGEIKAKVNGIEIYQFGRKEFVFEATEEDKKLAKMAIEKAEELLKEKPFMLILDEINVALHFKLISLEDVLKLLEKRGETHIVLTGRKAPQKLIEMADVATEMKKIKHYYDKGQEAIEGLEY